MRFAVLLSASLLCNCVIVAGRPRPLWSQPWIKSECRPAEKGTLFNVTVVAFDDRNEPIPSNIRAEQIAGPNHAPWQLKVTGMTNPGEPAELLLREGIWRIRAELPPFREAEHQLTVGPSDQCTVTVFTTTLSQQPIV